MPWRASRAGRQRILTWPGFAACYTIWDALNSCGAGTPLRTPRVSATQRWASGSSLARTPMTRLPQQTSEILSRPTSTTSSSARASPITATFACRHNSTSVHGASAISCAMATKSTLCAPSPTAPSTPSSRLIRTHFSPAGSRHRLSLPLTSAAASHAMNATSPQTTWWDSSALCLSSSIQRAARWRASRAISTACSMRPLALRAPLPIPPRQRPRRA